MTKLLRRHGLDYRSILDLVIRTLNKNVAQDLDFGKIKVGQEEEDL